MRTRLHGRAPAALLLAIGAGTLSVRTAAAQAKTPCQIKQAYDAAAKKSRTAHDALNTYQSDHGLVPWRVLEPRATLQNRLNAAKARVTQAHNNAVAANQADATATTELDDVAKQISALHLKLANLPADAKDPASKQPTADPAELKLYQQLKKKITTLESGITATLPGLDLTAADPEGLVDSRMRKLQQDIQAKNDDWKTRVEGQLGGQTSFRGDMPAPITPGFVAPSVATAVTGTQVMEEKLQDALRDFDQKSQQTGVNGAGAVRADITKRQGDIATALQAVEVAAAPVAEGVKKQIGALRQKKLDADDLNSKSNGALEAASQPAASAGKSERDKISEEITRLEALKAQRSKAAEAAQKAAKKADGELDAANVAVDELNLALKALDADDGIPPVTPAYDNEADNARRIGADAEKTITEAESYLTDLGAIEPDVLKYGREKTDFTKRVNEYNSAKGNPASPPRPGALEALKQEKARLLAEKARLKQLIAAKGYKNFADACSKKAAFLNRLTDHSNKLAPYACFPGESYAGVDKLLDRIGKATPKLSARAVAPSLFRFASYTAEAPARHTTRGAEAVGPRSLMARLRCSLDDTEFADDLEHLDDDIPLDEDAIAPSDSVPDDVVKNTGEVKVPRFFVFTLTSASGGLYVGDEDEVKTRANCSFVGGGVGCKATDYVKYKKLLGPFPTQEEAQQALCGAITATRIFPFGIGLKGQWQGSNVWYGLWDASVSGCKKP